MVCSSNKITYGSRSDAKRAAKFIKKAGKGNQLFEGKPPRLRPYYCRECNQWHLTSQSKSVNTHGVVLSRTVVTTR